MADSDRLREIRERYERNENLQAFGSGDIPFLLTEINKLQAEIERLRSRPALAPFSGEDVLPE